MARNSTISVETIPLINHAFNDNLIHEFVQPLHAYMPDDLNEAETTRLRIRLEVRLRRAYRNSFEHGEDYAHMQMDAAFDEFVAQYEGMSDGGHGDGGSMIGGFPNQR